MLKNTMQTLLLSDMERIHSFSLEILEKKGYMFHNEKSRQILVSHGAQLNGAFTKIPPKLMERFLSDSPLSFEWKGRSSSLMVGEGQEHCLMCQNHGPVSIHDVNGVRRYGNLEDVANFYKLGQSSLYTGIVGQVSIDPHGLDPQKKDILIARELLKHTDKPILSYPMETKNAQKVFTMVKALFGERYLDSNYVIGASITSLSPLQYSHESCEAIMWYAQNKQPLMFMSGPMLGVTGPMNYTQSIILQNVENLAGIALAHAICPDLPVIYGTLGTISNMYNGTSLVGDPDTIRINKASLEMAQFYGIPTRCITTGTDAKLPDIQSGYESMQSNLAMLHAGCNLMNECFGILDAMLGISYEKYIIDEEIFSRNLRMNIPLNIKEDDFALEAFMDIDDIKTFLLDEETIDACADLWRPIVSERNSYEIWEKNGSLSALDKAQNILKERLQSAPKSLLSPNEEKILNTFCE